jgi:probable F420-dependent oxidoreductase
MPNVDHLFPKESSMHIGVTFPQTEIGEDPGAIRHYGQAVEALGYTHLLAYDHVLGADTRVRPDWRGPYTSETPFHEIFVLFSHLAAITTRLEFVTGVVILPQRQTALVAKQAAAIDLLSGGRLRLGVGVGWNAVEYEGLNEDFHNRGARCEEQIALLRALWTEPVITFNGKWHTVTAAGINPLPVQRPIPIWIGGYQDVTLRRTARLGDGYFPGGPPDAKMAVLLETLRGYIRDEGRDPASVGIDARISVGSGTPAEWQTLADAWRTLGATHLSLNTMGAGLSGADAHLAALTRAAEALGVRHEV